MLSHVPGEDITKIVTTSDIIIMSRHNKTCGFIYSILTSSTSVFNIQLLYIIYLLVINVWLYNRLTVFPGTLHDRKGEQRDCWWLEGRPVIKICSNCKPKSLGCIYYLCCFLALVYDHPHYLPMKREDKVFGKTPTKHEYFKKINDEDNNNQNN